MKKIFVNKKQADYYFQRVLLFCAFHKIKTLAEFIEITKGKKERE
jgi:hypothetical protein